MIKIQLPHYLFHSVLSPRHRNIYLRNGDAVLQPQLRQYRYFTTIYNLHGRFFFVFLTKQSKRFLLMTSAKIKNTTPKCCFSNYCSSDATTFKGISGDIRFTYKNMWCFVIKQNASLFGVCVCVRVCGKRFGSISTWFWNFYNSKFVVSWVFFNFVVN